MVEAIKFAVRTSAGNVVHGGVAGDGGSEFLQVGSGETVSLNLSQSSVMAYEHQGNDLILKLADGRAIVLSNYFVSNVGEDNKLYLSSNGDVTEVFLTDAGDGVMYANYGPVDTWNKYSNVDDIRFTEDNTLMAADAYADDTVGMGPFAPALLAGLGGSGLGAAAAVVGGAALVGGLASGGGSDSTGTSTSTETGGSTGGTTDGSTGTTVETRVPPTVNEATGSKDITTNTPDQTVIVTGTGQPGETVEVVIGDKTETTTIGEDGTWETEFKDDNFPGDGSFEAEVTVTDEDGNKDELDGPGFVIDLTPPAVSTTDGTVSAGDVENLVEYANGVTVAGEGEAGATIDVTVGEGTSQHTQSTTVKDDGTWDVTFTQTQIAGGEYTLPVTITATDPMGNQTVITDQIAIDTVPNPLSFNSVTADNTINKTEAAGIVNVTGTSTAGAAVTVMMEGNSQTVTTDAQGNWSVTYPAGTFATSDGTRTFTATTVDAAGNTSSSTHTMLVDTTTTVTFSAGNLTADNIINGTEANEGVTLTGTAEAGSQSVSVQWNGVTLPVDTLNADGTWSVKFPTSAVQATGTTTATVTAVDAYGNTDTDTRSITVDRSTTVAVNSGQAGGDNIIMSTEANNGVALNGTAEAGAKVDVTFQGNTHTVTAGSDGTWSTTFTSSEITRGTYSNGTNNTVNVTATDTAGNVATTTHTLNVDTEVTNFTSGTDSYNSIKADGVLNNAEALNGLTVTGTVEAGSTVSVQLGDAGPYNAVVNGTTWSYTFAASDIPNGDTTATLTATAKDALGNVSAPYTETIDIDRIVTPFSRETSTLGGDGTLNADEVAAGLDLSGTGEIGSTVVITLPSGESQTVIVGNSGTWTTTFASTQLPQGEGTLDISFAATDLAGNVTSFTESVKYDTIAEDAPNVTDILKSTSGTTGLSGVFLDETIDSSFTFHRVGDDGSETQMTLRSGSVGSDFARFDGATVPEGDYLVINHADAAGNDSATLLVTNNTGTSTVDLGNTAFQDFDFTSLDLTLAPTNMTISAEDLIAITGPENVLTVKGGADDHITLQGGTLAADQGSAPEGFTLYTLGDNASVYLDDDIQATL
jgi:hypothetical protein